MRLSILSLCLLSVSCSIRKWALNEVADVLTAEGSTVFTGDEDPELIGDALPFALKTYESLLTSLPDNTDLLLATGKGFCVYAYAFVQMPADILPDTKISEKTAQHHRAKRLFLRARKYLLRALDLRHPGFIDLLKANKTDSALAMTTDADTALLYWAGVAWMGAFNVDKFDMTLAVNMKKPVAFIQRVLDINDTFGEGSAHEFFISYYGSLPASMGGDKDLARKHFARALELSKGMKASPYVALASSVCVAEQDVAEFKELLNKALAIDVDSSPRHRLANILNQRKARWLLDHIDNYFLLDDENTP